MPKVINVASTARAQIIQIRIRVKQQKPDFSLKKKTSVKKKQAQTNSSFRRTPDDLSDVSR